MEDGLDRRILPDRAGRIERVGAVGLAVNFLLAAFKAFVGFLSGSIAIMLDAVNNLTDMLSGAITIAGVRLAKRKPDREHPFGHGRIEYFSAMVIAVIVLILGVASLAESVRKILNPVRPEYSPATLIVVGTATVVKILLGRYVKRKGTELRSDALIAAGADALFDAAISAATLAGAVLTLAFGILPDGWIGAAISLYILKAGVQMLMRPFNLIMGLRPDAEVTAGIRRILTEPEEVLGAYDLMLHNYGPDSVIGSANLEVRDTMNIRTFQEMTRILQQRVAEEYGAAMTIGLFAVHTDDDSQGQMRRYVTECAMAHSGVCSVHGVYFNKDEHVVSFDLVIDFSVTDRKALADHIAGDIRRRYPRCRVRIRIDTDYSD